MARVFFLMPVINGQVQWTHYGLKSGSMKTGSMPLANTAIYKTVLE